jgi:folate-binding protein YgfZ
MTAEFFREIEEKGGCVDLSDRAKFRLTGADRVRYLNGQVTNDVKKATDESAMRACVTNAKGRIEAEVFLHAGIAGNSLWLDAEPGLREALASRLDRYIVADDVTLEDVTETGALWHYFGPAAQDLRQVMAHGHGLALVSNRLGEPGVDVWQAGADPAEPPYRHPALNCPILSPGDWETLRILRGVPRWPNELNNEAFPQEAGLEVNAMDFAKGCYIGQEVLSRIKTTGKMPRVLRGFHVHGSGVPVEAGMILVIQGEGEEAKETGVVTSVARHPLLDRAVGLAYVRQAFGAADSLLLAREDPPRILGKVDFTAS